MVLRNIYNVFIFFSPTPPEHLRVLAVDPPSVRLVDAGRTRQSPLGQRADGNQTADDGVWVLATLGHRLDQRLVTVRGRLDGVVMVPSQHTRLEFSDNLGTLADRTNILGGYGTHAARARLARVPVRLPVLPTHGDRLARAVLNISGPNDRAHFSYFYVRKKSPGPKVLDCPRGGLRPRSQVLSDLLVTLQKNLEFCIV